jgi:RNA polymerase sigma-70 factor (ECF subfamily)
VKRFAAAGDRRVEQVKPISGDATGVEQFAQALRRYFSKRAARNDVEDLVQEVLLRMHCRRAEAEIENLQGYVFTVAANVLKERQHAAGGLIEGRESIPEISDELTPERIVTARLQAAQAMHLIGTLPLRTREIFVAHRFEEMTYSAIASLYGISVSAVEKHIMAALRVLSSALKGGT